MGEDDISEDWNMAKAYYYRIDQILTAITQAHIEGNPKLWYQLLTRLFVEIQPKLTDKETTTAEQLRATLTEIMSKKQEQVSTESFLDFELYLRNMLNKRNMLTPKTWDKGL